MHTDITHIAGTYINVFITKPYKQNSYKYINESLDNYTTGYRKNVLPFPNNHPAPFLYQKSDKEFLHLETITLPHLIMLTRMHFNIPAFLLYPSTRRHHKNGIMLQQF